MTCAACRYSLERHWNYCPDCGEWQHSTLEDRGHADKGRLIRAEPIDTSPKRKAERCASCNFLITRGFSPSQNQWCVCPRPFTENELRGIPEKDEP